MDRRSFPGQDSRHSSRAIGQDSRLTWMAFERRCIRRARCKQSAVQPFAGPLKVVLLTPARRIDLGDLKMWPVLDNFC